MASLGSVFPVRSQRTLDDVPYMTAMIPHPSIAILTSRRAHIRDSRRRKLADGIIEAHAREIGETGKLIADLDTNPAPDQVPALYAVLAEAHDPWPRL